MDEPGPRSPHMRVWVGCARAGLAEREGEAPREHDYCGEGSGSGSGSYQD